MAVPEERESGYHGASTAGRGMTRRRKAAEEATKRGSEGGAGWPAE